MISCLSNYIGIRGVAGFEAPTSGLYINSLYGISTDILENISQDEEYDLQTSWENIVNRATLRLESDINTWASKYFLNYSVIGNNITGQYDENTALSTSNHYNGWLFDMYTYSPNLSLKFNTIELYLASSVSSTIRIYNATTGTLLDTVSFSGVAGINTIHIAKEYPIWKYPNLFICYDQNVVNTIAVDDMFLGGYDFLSNRKVPTGSSVVKSNLDSSDGTGMIVNYDLTCSIDNFVCQRRDIFKESFWYLLGVEFCNERVYSDRINRYTLLNRDDATALGTDLEAKYTAKINGVLKGLKMDQNDECFICNKAVNYRTMIP